MNRTLLIRIGLVLLLALAVAQGVMMGRNTGAKPMTPDFEHTPGT